jgi:hypothetical protein
MPVPRIETRLLLFVVALFVLCPIVGTASSSATAATRVASAVAIGAGGKASGVKATCAREAKRKMRRLAAGAGASSVSPRRMRRTKASLRRRCLARFRRKRPQATAAGTPNAAPLAVGIDGGYGGWTDEEVELRDVLEAASEVHTRIHALLGGNDLGDPAQYRDFVVAFIRRYGVGGSFWSEHPELDASRYAITSFELGNEPYFGTMSASEYADAVRPALEAVKQQGLPGKIVLASYIYDEDTHWIDTLYQRIPNLNEFFYAFADHPYWYGHDPAETGDGNSPFERIDTLRRKMAEHGAGLKPIFITEYGESTANCGEECVSEPVQTAHLQTMIDAAVSRDDWGVELLCLYQLHDWSADSSSREEQFGILHEDGSPKAAYSAAREAMQRYRG